MVCLSVNDFSKVIIINGWSAHASLWRGVIEQLSDVSEAYEVVVIDLDRAGYKEYLAGRLEREVVDNTLLIGWSLGGQLAMDILASNPVIQEHIGAVIVIGTSLRFVEGVDWKYGYSADEFNDLMALCNEDGVERLHRTFAHMLTRGSTSRADRKLVKQKYLKENLPATGVLLEGLQLLASLDISQALLHVKTPILWLLGEHDALVSRSIEEVLYESGSVNLKVLEHMAHLPVGECWPMVYEEISSFCEAL